MAAERLYTKEDAALVAITLVSTETSAVGPRMAAIFPSIGDVLLRRYAAKLLDVGPIICLYQAVALSLGVPRGVDWSTDDILLRLHQFEEDVGLIVVALDKEKAGG